MIPADRGEKVDSIAVHGSIIVNSTAFGWVRLDVHAHCCVEPWTDLFPGVVEGRRGLIHGV